MNKYIKIFFFFIATLFFQSCGKEDHPNIYSNWDEEAVIYYGCIWKNSPHCAFTDLIEYKNVFYCTFREGANHIPRNEGEYGKITILSSIDGENWISALTLQDPKYDLRDPKFSISPNDNLFITYGNSCLDEYSNFKLEKTAATFFSVENNMINKDISHDIFANKWLWRIVWHKGYAYGVAYLSGKPVLARSTNGIDYEIIKTFHNLEEANEADLFFDENDQLLIVIRSNQKNGYVGKADYPYNSWSWKELNEPIHSPKIFSIKNEIFLTGRGNIGGNVIYHMDKHFQLRLLYVFPGKKDTGYPGVIKVADEIWISYYTTSHRDESTAIYLVKMDMYKVLEKVNK